MARAPERPASPPGPTAARTPGATAALAPAERGWAIALALAVCLAGIARAFPVLGVSFMSDDYLILDKVMCRDFAQLWKFDYNIFGWYRPWSREIHFWSLYHLAGTDARVYHLASLALWLAVLLMFAAYVRREAGVAAAVIATTGLAALASWGAPMLWISGCQELWLAFWSLAYLHVLGSRHARWAPVPLLLALLSKETALVLPAIGLAYRALVSRPRAREQILRLAGDVAVTAVWAFVHPTLVHRLVHPLPSVGDQLPSQWLAIPYSLLSFVNLEAWPRPEGNAWAVLVMGLWRMLPLLAIALLAVRAARRGTRGHPSEGRVELGSRTGPDRGRMLFALVWIAVGIGCLLSRTIGWHAYYAILAAIGAWYLLGMLLERRRWLAFALLAVVIVLEPLRAETPSWDAASFAYQQRAGIFCGNLRAALMKEVPKVSPHTRLYFVGIPQNVGFVTADGPAFRVLYGDSTLRGWFMGRYAPRDASAPRGEDLFLSFDGVATMHRMLPAAAPPPGADPEALAEWESDGRTLAWTFGHAHDWPRAADQFVALSRARPESVEYAANAADCFRRAGDVSRAEEYLARARKLGLRESPPGDWSNDPAAHPRR